jgi:23S rRNA (uridine2552-2'-O)-methyltransferase
MPRSKSSNRWLREHVSDPYVKQAKAAGYRSRSAYKLLALQEKYKIFKAGGWVLDLGAAPGGWSQVAAAAVGPKGHVVAVDCLAMAPLAGVTFLQGDLTQAAVLDELQGLLASRKVDVVVSDMAPNLSGERSIDQPRAMYLCDLALEACQIFLKTQGAFVVKAFQGEGFEAFTASLRQAFDSVIISKPSASRSRSSEVYLIARGFKTG